MATELVGGAVLQAVFGVLLDRLTPRVEFLNFVRGKKLDKNLFHRLKPTLIAARAVLNDAELKQIKNSAVKEWLDDLKDAVYDADDLVDEISTKAATQNQVLNFSSSDLNMHDIEMGNKLQTITDRLELIVNLKDVLGLKVSEPEILLWRPQSTSLVEVSDVYGREKEKEAIIKFLSNDNDKLSVIPIVGMGGIGKTIFVQLVYNDDHVKQNFDLKVWVCVSETFDLLKITYTLIKAITPDYVRDIMDLNLLQHDLNDKLSGKKFLIILDDIWNENYTDWDTLIKPFQNGIQGSKVLVTTRSEKVASMVKTVSSFYRLGLLSDEDILSLFARHAFHSSESTSNACLTKIGRDILKRCKGLPLAAKVLGGLFRSNPNINYWNTIWKNDMWDSTENEITPVLRVSYHYLPSHLKQCFVYCSLFPEDYEFDKKTLVLMWMAEGFLQASKRGLTLEEVGYEYFDDLASRSFFQPSSQYDGYFVMHDLIHSLATSIAGDFYCNLKMDENGDKISIMTRHLCYSTQGYPNLDHFESFKRAKALRTFIRLPYRHIPDSIENNLHYLLSNLKYLRVLSLVSFRENTIHDSIGELIHLRYLDLSYACIVSLPGSLCKLYNLQTLYLIGCKYLTMLPNDMHHLVKLRYLDIRHTVLKELPRGLSKLKDLQFLSGFIVGKEQGTMIGELGELSNLQDSLHISKLENIGNGNEAYEAKMTKKEKIKSLILSWSSDDCMNDSLTEKDILDKLQPHWNLEHLSINGYRGTIFPDWLGSCSYHNMIELSFTGCRNCCMLPSLGQLPSLKKLDISEFDRVMIIDVDFFKGNGCASVTPFASLEYLYFRNMSTWKKWNSIEMEAFPKLRELGIYNCPKLTGDLPCQLISLETLNITKCPLLASSIPKCPVLQHLYMRESEKVVLQELPLSLCFLRISGDRLVKFTFETKMHAEDSHLKQLRVWNCSSLTTLSAEIFPNLENFDISGCESLNSVLGSNTPLQNLQRMEVYDCKNLKSLSSHTNSLLPSLKKLSIRDCPEIEPNTKPFLPPSLLELEIHGCDKLLACRLEWHLPSLTDLCIGQDDSVKCFPEEDLLPPTLRKLHLYRFSILESLDCKGLQYLTALQELVITDCPKLQTIAGEMLPVSLINLNINDCYLLEERYRKKDGEIWPKISHIPAIWLNGELIS